MAVSPFSAAMRAPSGYAMKPVVAAPPMQPWVTPAMPSVPAIDDARAPNALGRTLIQQQLSGLDGKYGPQLTAANAGARQALSGYGGFKWAVDDPTTAQREDLQAPTYDPNARLGANQHAAVSSAKNQANAQGTLYSSFTATNIGSALTRLNEEARGIVNQHASQINSILGTQSAESTSLVNEMARLYGQDMAWLVQNPPPTPALPPDSRDYHPGNPNGLAYENPNRPGAPPARSMTYLDFLRGRKSTPALAHAWDSKFNGGRRFGGGA